MSLRKRALLFDLVLLAASVMMWANTSDGPRGVAGFIALLCIAWIPYDLVAGRRGGADTRRPSDAALAP